GTYNQEGIERWQKRMKERLATKQSQQGTEFERQILLSLYGPDHAYTKTGVITSDAVGKISKDTLDAFRKSHFTAGNATLIVTGDFDPKYAEKLVHSGFGGWSKGSLATPVDTAMYKRNGPTYVGVVGKEEPQLELRIAYPAPSGVDG